ncbi:hypothetical protein HPB47_000423 [Ixodes persulcatus]|uniref:Uncharacterized protein n=1 Tax=Ixodes persulcatus TaxID=34615 RepID=A0AC60PRS9_IXOPE|nr:hypothetical protein HPB47_000423 [Ixodes persulcatus]
MWPRYVVWADAFSPAASGGNDRSSSARGSGAAVENNGFSRTCNLPSIDQRRSDFVQRHRLTGGGSWPVPPRACRNERQARLRTASTAFERQEDEGPRGPCITSGGQALLPTSAIILSDEKAQLRALVPNPALRERGRAEASTTCSPRTRRQESPNKGEEEPRAEEKAAREDPREEPATPNPERRALDDRALHINRPGRSPTLQTRARR